MTVQLDTRPLPTVEAIACTHWVEGRVGPTWGMDDLERLKIVASSWSRTRHGATHSLVTVVLSLFLDELCLPQTVKTWQCLPFIAYTFLSILLPDTPQWLRLSSGRQKDFTRTRKDSELLPTNCSFGFWLSSDSTQRHKNSEFLKYY
jgi:hypothetical protein